MDTEAQRVEDIDLTDVDLFLSGDPHAAWRRLRHEAPVHYNQRSWGPGFWNITRYEDVLRVSVDPQTFISSNGIVLDNDGRRTERERRFEQAGALMDPRGHMMIMTDPPRHALMRQLVNKAFTRKAVARIEGETREIVTRIVDEVAERGECDFVLDISRKLPLEVICKMVGVPEGDWEAMFDLSNRVIGFDDPEYARDEISVEDMQMATDLFQYFMTLISDRRTTPRDDVLTALVEADIDGERLQDFEIYLFFLLLIIAGNETTRNATSGGMLALMEHPDQAARLRDDPSLMPVAVEEIVRWTTPVVHFTRTATTDVDIRGVTIREGEEVCLWYPSANRDEDVFANGGVFDVARTPNEHIAFGKGEHFCLGANLARLEIRTMLEEILRRLPDMTPAGPVEKLRSNFIGGIKRMPVQFSPARSAA